METNSILEKKENNIPTENDWLIEPFKGFNKNRINKKMFCELFQGLIEKSEQCERVFTISYYQQREVTTYYFLMYCLKDGLFHSKSYVEEAGIGKFSELKKFEKETFLTDFERHLKTQEEEKLLPFALVLITDIYGNKSESRLLFGLNKKQDDVLSNYLFSN